MPWADRDRRDGPQEGFVDSLASTSSAFIAGWAPSTAAAKRSRVTEYALEWQQRKQAKICAQGGPLQGLNPLPGRDSKAVHRVLLCVKPMRIRAVSLHEWPKGAQWFRCKADSSRPARSPTETAWAFESRATYPERLSTNEVPIPMGSSEYKRLREGKGGGLQSQESNVNGSCIASCWETDGIAPGLSLSRLPTSLPRRRNVDSNLRRRVT